MNQEMQQALSKLKEKVKTLVHTNEQLVKTNTKLDNAYELLQQKISLKNNTIEKLQTELRAKQASNAMRADNQKIEKDLDKYIKLIDNSIASIQKDL